MRTERMYLEAAVGHFQNGLYFEAAHVCLAGLDRFPDAGRLWEVYGTSLWLLGQIKAAQEALETASVLVPLVPRAQLALASAYAHADKPDLARLIYHHLSKHPDFPGPLLPQLAAALGQIGEDEAALLVCEQIVKRQPEYHPAWFGIAFYLRRMGRPVWTVIPHLRVAHELAPDRRTYRLNLAACYAEVGRHADAYRCLEGIPVAEVRCSHWLAMMAGVFTVVGDTPRHEECRGLLERLTDGPDPEGWDPEGTCPCR